MANHWSHHLFLLERAVQSMLNQAGGDCYVVIGCHEVPDCQLAGDPRVVFVPVSHSVPARTNDDMCSDKVLKLSAAIAFAISKGCDYVAFNDADDLVSNRIGAFVDRNRGLHGWFSGCQYFYRYGARVLRWSIIPPTMSGPFAVVRSDLLTFSREPYQGQWIDIVEQGGEHRYLRYLFRHKSSINTLAAVGLAHYQELMSQEGSPLNPLPFAANVVVNHEESTSHVAGGIGSYEFAGNEQPRFIRYVRTLKRTIRSLPSVRYLTPSLRREFNIPSRQLVPVQFRNGSIMWR